MIMWGQPAFICALLASAVLLRRMPLIALGVTMAGLVVLSVAPKTELPASALQIVAACAAGLEVCYMAATRTREVSGTGVAIAGIGLPILILELPPPTSLPPNGSSGTPIPLVTIAAPLAMIIAWLIGNSIRQAQARAELVRAQAAAQTVVAERLRIARELHDMVAHSIGIVAIQAGAAKRCIQTQPVLAAQALDVIETTSRETLTGLRHMLVALRKAEADRAGVAPMPGLDDLPALADNAAKAGVAV